MIRRSGFAMILIVILGAFVLVLIFMPIPRHRSEPVFCNFGLCRGSGWYWQPSVVNGIIDNYKHKSEDPKMNITTKTKSSDDFRDTTTVFNEEFAFGRPYPPSVKNIDSESLIGIDCTETYLRQSDGKFTTYEQGVDVELIDPIIDAILDELNDELAFQNATVQFRQYQYQPDSPQAIEAVALMNTAIKAHEIYKCVTENDHIIINYMTYAGGGGTENVSHHGIYKDGNLVDRVDIPTDGSPYFTCRQPLAYTKDNTMYLTCGGGDAGYGSLSIYLIDFELQTYQLIYKCESFSNLDGNPPGVSCI